MPVILPGASAYGKFLPVFGQELGGWRVLAGDWAGLSADRACMRPAVAEWAGEHATAGLTYKTVSGSENVTLARREVSRGPCFSAREARRGRPSGTYPQLDD
jgi:hypothetical protein